MLVYTKILLYPTCLVVVERHNAQPTSSHHHPHPAAHQVLVALPPILDMPLPPIFRDILLYCKIPAFSFVIDNLGMSCFVATDFYWQLVTSTLMPPVMIVLLYLYNFCRGCVNLTSIYCRNDRSSDGLITFTAKRSTGLALLILYAMLPVTSATIFSIFGCENFDDGSSLLRTDFSVSCQDPRLVHLGPELIPILTLLRTRVSLSGRCLVYRAMCRICRALTSKTVSTSKVSS